MLPDPKNASCNQGVYTSLTYNKKKKNKNRAELHASGNILKDLLHNKAKLS